MNLNCFRFNSLIIVSEEIYFIGRKGKTYLSILYFHEDLG